MILLAFFTYLNINASSLEVDSTLTRIDNLLERTANRQGVPGISVAITGYAPETIFSSYGVTRRGEEILVDEETFFGLGSLSKAFSALSILYLDRNEEFDFKIEDPIQKHLPWLNFYHQDADFKMEELTIANFIYHTSGLVNAVHSLQLPPSEGLDAAQRIIESLNDSRLEFRPGTKYDYASSNYIILGLVIQNVTGLSFEEFTTTRILQPLNLNNTFMFQSEAETVGVMASAHKPIWFASRPFNPPTFRAHTPTGFIISNASDMMNWLKLNLNPDSAPAPFDELIERALEANLTVDAWQGYHYAAGWLVGVETSTIRHQGESPGFASEVVMLPDSGIGVVVLMNSIAGDTANLIANILLILDGQEVDTISIGNIDFILFDMVFSIISILAILVSIILIFLIIRKILKIKRRAAIDKKLKMKNYVNLLLAALFFMSFLILATLFPSFFGVGTWEIVNIWMSYSVFMGFVLIIITCFIWVVLALLGVILDNPKIKV